jgi:Family of unknown function (DUF5681)
MEQAMSNDENASRNTLPRQADVATDVEAAADADNRVGYRQPPRHSRFQPGQSGNPRVRPPGVKSLSDIVRKIVGQKVTVTENGRARRVPRLEAILLRAAGEASRGDARALRLLLQLTERYGEIVQTGSDREVTGAEDLAILRRYLPDFDDPSPIGLIPQTERDGGSKIER